MACESVSKHKSWLLKMMMIGGLIVWQTQGVCIEEEGKALFEIKASLIDSYDADPLPTWVDDWGRSGGECCDWERVTCNTITGHVTNLSLSNIMGMAELEYPWIVHCKGMWPLNVSVFLHFKELTSLDLSRNCLDNNIVSTGLERLSSLKNLEILDLSSNLIENVTISSLGALTSLRDLNLGYNKLEGYFPALALENLEILDLTYNFMQGFERVSLFKKLKDLNLRGNAFNENQFITSLSHALPLLKTLHLSDNSLSGSFPATECTRLSRLKKLQSITLGFNNFNKSIISCLSALPSLKTLDLSWNSLGGSIPIQGMF